jgi:hypothetical protein
MNGVAGTCLKGRRSGWCACHCASLCVCMCISVLMVDWSRWRHSKEGKKQKRSGAVSARHQPARTSERFLSRRLSDEGRPLLRWQLLLSSDKTMRKEKEVENERHTDGLRELVSLSLGVRTLHPTTPWCIYIERERESGRDALVCMHVCMRVRVYVCMRLCVVTSLLILSFSQKKKKTLFFSDGFSDEAEDPALLFVRPTKHTTTTRKRGTHHRALQRSFTNNTHRHTAIGAFCTIRGRTI